MKRDVCKILLEMVITIIIIVWSFPIWDALAKQIPNINASSACLENLEMYFIEEPVLDSVFTSNAEINELKPTRVKVSNTADEDSCGRLFLSYSKSSILDYQYIRVSISGTMYDLSSFLMTSNDTHFIFIIDTLDLPPLSSREYEIYIRLRDDELINFNLEYYDYNINLGIGY